MINIDKFKKFVDFASNKNGRGTIPPSQFDISAERSVVSWTNKQVGDVDVRNPNLAIDRNQVAMEKIRHLKEFRKFRVTNGLFKTPNGVDVTDINTDIAPKYWFLSALSHNILYKDINGNPISEPREFDIIKDSEYAMRMRSRIKPPTLKHPISVLRSEDFKVAPTTVQIVELVYAREPITPLWAYTMSNGRPLYNSATSKDLDAPESAFNEIAAIYLGYMGIHIRENDLVTYATELENSPK